MADQVTQFKENGNKAMGDGKLDEGICPPHLPLTWQAIEWYTKGLALEANNHILYTNRSLVYGSKKEWPASLKDAQAAIRSNPSWMKGHLRAAEALWALGRKKEACVAYDEALKLSSDSAPLIKSAYKAHAAYIEEFFTPLLARKEIAVKYINRNRGRGVFAKKKFLKGEIVYFENPLASMRCVEPEKDHIQACAYTMKSIIPIDDLKFPFQQVMEERKGLPTEFIPCPHCKDAPPLYAEKYISENAREKAWNEHHQVLCVGQQGKDHPVAQLIDQARAAKRTNPLFILRMFGCVATRIKERQQTDKPREQIISEALEPFSMFIANEEKGPLENETVQTINQLAPGNEDVFTLSLYRSLNGAILRNAQDLNPLSELLVAVNCMGPQSRAGAIKAYNKEYESQEELLQDEWFMSLCFHGSGLFLIGNSTNHSCDPNIVSTSSTNNFTITMVALKDIAVNEELCISYIDQSLPYDERQSKLKDMYLFDCKCERCTYRW